MCTNGDSGQRPSAASSRLSVPTAFVSKSSKGIAAARSCDGWAAVCTMAVGRSVAHEPEDAGAIPDVELVVLKALAARCEPLLIPAGIALRSEKLAR